MNQRFQQEEIRRVSEQNAGNELYSSISSIGPQLESEFQFGLCAEECFMEVRELLSTVADRGEGILADVERIWFDKFNEYRRFDRHMNEDDVRTAVGIVFGFTILALDSSRHPFYRYTLVRRLTQVVAGHQFDGWTTTLGRIFSVPLPDGWFDAFIEEGNTSSLISASKRSKAAKPKKKAERKPNERPKTLRYYTHGQNSILMKQRKRVVIIFKKWSEWGWIDKNTTAEDFDVFFEGELRHCNITWTANTTILTILLQELLKQSYIRKQTGCTAKSLVVQQFGKTANSDRSRLSDDDNFKIQATVFLLDINNPLPQRKGGGDDDYDIKDVVLQDVLTGQLRATKGI